MNVCPGGIDRRPKGSYFENAPWNGAKSEARGTAGQPALALLVIKEGDRFFAPTAHVHNPLKYLEI
jgi:hypothetical protein